MELRERIVEALKDAMRAKSAERLSTLRLINAAIKDREIALRSDPDGDTVGEAEIIAILARMIKQRHESVRAYEEGGRLELAEKEADEIKVLEEFLPRQMDASEVTAAIEAAVTATGATGIRDIGRVIAELKTRYVGQMDFGAVGPLVKARLT